MLTAKNLEKIMELESTLKAQYQQQLDTQSNQIKSLVSEREKYEAVALEEKQARETLIATQLEKITSLTSETTKKNRVEQLNRELHNRSENLQAEVTKQTLRVKALQKDLAQEREELKTLKKYDPVKMKKNLDATKKKLTENQKTNELLQKSINKSKTEKSELQQKIKELETQLAELDVTEDTEKTEEAVAA
jgi:chromosome segregation ATPase